MGCIAGIAGIPSQRVHVVSTAILLRFPAATAGIFPFRFGGQAVSLAGLRVELFDELLNIMETDSFNRAVVTALFVIRRLMLRSEPLKLGETGL